MATVSLGDVLLGVPIHSITIRIGTDANQAFHIQTRLVLKDSAIQHCKDSLLAVEAAFANPSVIDYQVGRDVRDVLYEAARLNRDVAAKRIPKVG